MLAYLRHVTRYILLACGRNLKHSYLGFEDLRKMNVIGASTNGIGLPVHHGVTRQRRFTILHTHSVAESRFFNVTMGTL